MNFLLLRNLASGRSSPLSHSPTWKINCSNPTRRIRSTKKTEQNRNMNFGSNIKTPRTTFIYNFSRIVLLHFIYAFSRFLDPLPTEGSIKSLIIYLSVRLPVQYFCQELVILFFRFFSQC